MNDTDITKNNWILPVTGDEPRTDDEHQRHLEDLALHTYIGWGTAPIFWQMYHKHIVDYFGSLDYKHLLIYCRRLDLPVIANNQPPSLDYMRSVLVQHFKRLTNAA